MGVIAAGQALRLRGGVLALLDILVGRPRIKFTAPHGIAVDATIVAITDSARGEVHLLHREARRYQVIGAAGETSLRCPIGVASDGSGGIFVADSALGRVFHLSVRGALKGEIKGEFVRPTGLAYDIARRQLHVVDTGSHTVLSYEQREGRFVRFRTLGRRGEKLGDFNFPTHVTVDRDGRLYVADSLNHRIQVFGAEGDRLATFGRAGDGSGDFAKAKGVAVDSEGHIYVVDSLFDVVQIFDRKGRFLLAFGGRGTEEGSLWLPTGICIDDEDRIYVADSGNSRIQVYQYVR